MSLAVIVYLCTAGDTLVDGSDDAGRLVNSIAPSTKSQLIDLIRASPLELPPSPVQPIEQSSANASSQEPIDVDTLIVRVVHSTGAPADGARVLVSGVGNSVTQGLTDGYGHVTFKLPRGAVTIYVGGASGDVIQQQTGAPGTYEFLLPDGSTVDGTIFLAQGRKTDDAPLTLSLRALDRKPLDIPLGFSTLMARLGPPGADQLDANTQVLRDNGQFYFSGLQPQQRVRLQLSPSYRFTDGSRRLDVVAPARHLSLTVNAAPTIVGRVIWADTNSPIMECDVEYRIGYSLIPDSVGASPVAALEKGISGHKKTNARGDFRIPFDREVTSVELSVRAPDGAGLAHATYGAMSIPDADVGDILLNRSRVFRFRTIDGNRRPLAGAIATLADGEDCRSGPTDDSGLGTLACIPRTPADILVWCSERMVRRICISDIGDEPVDILLNECPSLTVAASDASAPLSEGITLHLIARSQVFSDKPEFGPAQMRSVFPGRAWSDVRALSAGTSAATTASGEVVYSVPQSGLVVLDCLIPGVPFDLILLDRSGGLLWSQSEQVGPGDGNRQVDVLLHTR